VNANTFDTLTQTISGLSVGATYTLTWAYDGRSGYGQQQMNVSFGGAPLESDFTSVSTQWTVSTYRVVASAASEVLSFAGLNVGGSASGGDELTNVSLMASAVPEPASLALLGFGVFGATMRRRKRA